MSDANTTEILLRISADVVGEPTRPTDHDGFYTPAVL